MPWWPWAARRRFPDLANRGGSEGEEQWDRHTACRALGMLGDSSVVPELVHLTYHYNWNTRQWAQISLVRLTGQNFGRDVAAGGDGGKSKAASRRSTSKGSTGQGVAISGSLKIR